jgi:hypothetical protein
MSSGQAWIIIIELGLFNVILAIVVTLTMLKSLRDP